MRCSFSITTFALMASLVLSPIPSLATDTSMSSSDYKVLSSKKSGFNIASIEKILKKGDSLASKGKLANARKQYDEARVVAKQLLAFYRDLGGSFRGLDARIPREMDKKGRETLSLLATVNLRLATIFRRQNQPEVAVPLLVEVIRLMTPADQQGQKAYQMLLELGFVETPYAGAR